MKIFGHITTVQLLLVVVAALEVPERIFLPHSTLPPAADFETEATAEISSRVGLVGREEAKKERRSYTIPSDLFKSVSASVCTERKRGKKKIAQFSLRWIYQLFLVSSAG